VPAAYLMENLCDGMCCVELNRIYNIQAGEQVDAGTSRNTGNPIDDCWRSDPNWAYNRQSLARCAVGFGANAMGGARGPIYVVTDDTDTDLVNPAPGTLRYGVLQDVS
jgi:hypothetical protein